MKFNQRKISNRLLRLEQTLHYQPVLAQSLLSSFSGRLHPKIDHELDTAAVPVLRESASLSEIDSESNINAHVVARAYDLGEPIHIQEEVGGHSAGVTAIDGWADGTEEFDVGTSYGVEGPLHNSLGRLEDLDHHDAVPLSNQVASATASSSPLGEISGLVEVEVLPPDSEDTATASTASEETWLDAEAYEVESFEEEEFSEDEQQPGLMDKQSQPSPASEPSPTDVQTLEDSDPFSELEASLGVDSDRAGDAASFEAELQAILRGQKSPSPTTSESISAEEPMPVSDNTAPTSAENRHAVFDRLGSAMNYATTYDLGSVPLEQRFDEFDQAITQELTSSDAKEISVVTPGDPEMNAVNLAEDFALMEPQQKLTE